MNSKLKKILETLVEIITNHPDGISIEEILHYLNDNTPRRTVQYRLSTLTKAGVIRMEGAGRNTKYHLNSFIANKPSPETALVAQASFTIPLSFEGEKIRKLITAPLQQRQHVSYRREFLDSYEPNKTFYLSPSILAKLSKLGAGAQQGRPAGTYARKIYHRLLIDLSWNSSRLEGNTYSILETEKLLETGEMVSGKSEMDAQMILNHKAAIEFIVDMAEEIDINRYTILNIHGLLSYNLLQDPKTCGRLRIMPAKIGKSVYHPVEIPQLIEECFQLIIQKASAIKNPFEQSFFLMIHLPYLQPFMDVNKRVSRLAGNIPLIRENLSPLSFVDVPASDYIQGLLAIYELNRIELFCDVFVWAYERSASLYLANLEALGQPDSFQIQYRDLIQQAIYKVVQSKMNKLTSAQFIAKFAKENVPYENRNRFIEIVEIEVSSLHEGNFARFKIRPSEFFDWHNSWK